MTDWISGLINQGGYLGVALLMLIETVFPPIPSEVIMPLSGMAAARGPMSLEGVIIAGTTGAMVGNTLWYLLARHLGIECFQPFIEKWGRWVTMTWSEVQKVDHWFDRHAWLIVLLGRMTPTLRSLISIPAGLFHMPLKTFLLVSTIGTLGWTSLLAFLGQKLGENYHVVGDYVGPASTGIMVALFAFYVYRVIRWRAQH